MLKECESCKKTFSVYRYRSDTARFCSVSCRAQVMSKGRKHSDETRRKIGLSNSLAQAGKSKPWSTGEKNWMWKGGITSVNEAIRKSLKYRNWRQAVFKRDDFTCQHCGERGGTLHADHIKPFAYFPELRFVVENGRTLCYECHKKTDTYSRRYNNKKYEHNKMVV